jgi:phosphoglycolate phosphatase
MTTPYQAAVFDLDGTLLDTLDDLADSLNFVLAEEGLPAHPTPEYRFMVGNGMENLVIRALPQGLRIPAHVRPILQKFMERYRANQCVKTRPYAGVPEMLAELGRRGIPLAVLSNKAHPNTLTVVDSYFPQTFQMVLGMRPEVPAKPDPSAALEIARAFNAAPQACLYLGDSNVDMKTARAAGMYAVGAAWGFRPVDELIAAGAGTVIEAPLDFVRFFDERE